MVSHAHDAHSWPTAVAAPCPLRWSLESQWNSKFDNARGGLPWLSKIVFLVEVDSREL